MHNDAKMGDHANQRSQFDSRHQSPRFLLIQESYLTRGVGKKDNNINNHSPLLAQNHFKAEGRFLFAAYLACDQKRRGKSALSSVEPSRWPNIRH